ncbi:transposase [Niabella beijingensis]|uniref:transposase n=1 Tax=Niabella beijingensis TaxID=2872700 RepID=UPI001CBFE5DC|nr:transposase [Niabella beijingensis]MBZ4192557.1 transposase [Niabella beijingensis]
MTNVNMEYLSRAEAGLLVTILAYFLLNGAQLFETAVLVPKWTAAPPLSFQFFKKPYGADLKTFWIIAHSIHEITFILAIAFCWKIGPVRNGLLLLFAVHFVLRAWTLLYFAPNIIEFQAIANGKPSGADLLSRTRQWRILNYIRVGIFFAVSFGQIPLLVKLAGLKNA